MANPRSMAAPPVAAPRPVYGPPLPQLRPAAPAANPAGSLGSLLLGIYLAFHACAAPEFVASYLGLSVKFVAPLAALILVVGLAAGNVTRFFENKVAFPYLLMGGMWVISTVSFSFKNEWTAILQYSIRYHILPILMGSILVTTASIRRCMTLYTFGFMATIGFCFLFGRPDAGGRFHIPETSFGNPNDLAFNLLFGVSHLMFFIRGASLFKRILALAAILPAIYYVLVTGSRANLLVLISLLLTLFFISSTRMKVGVVALSALLAVGAVAVLPQRMLTRLTSFTSADEEAVAADGHLQGALSSTEARKELQRRAAIIALQNPILGVGTGMYIYALNDLMVQQEGRAKGSWQHAHNTYLEIGAETGLISLSIYIGVLLWCIHINRKSLKLLQATRKSDDAQALSLALLLTSITFLIGTAFCSIPYTASYCVLLGFSAANWGIVRREWLATQPDTRPAGMQWQRPMPAR